MIPISGATRALPIIGRPTRQVKAPQFFNAFFEAQGIDAVCTAVELEDASVAGFIQAMRGWNNAAGYIATIPHKQQACAAADDRSERAEFLGAANLIRREADGRLVADMTDGLGCVEAMRKKGFDPAGKRTLVVGVGGAGSAIAHALAEAGAAQLTLTDLDMARAETLAARLRERFPKVKIDLGQPAMDAIDIAVNASPAGMNGDPSLPLPLDGVSPAALVADVVTLPDQTPWLLAAAAAGCTTQTGMDMVAGQFDLMAKHFRFA